MGEGLEAFRRLPQALEARELGRAGGLPLDVDHDSVPRGLAATLPPITHHIGIFRYVNQFFWQA
jgi:hypothetical protein